MEKINKRSSSQYIISRVMSNAKGIGESKTQAKALSNIKGQNGHNVSSKAHSIKSIQNLRSVTTQYIKYLQNEFNTNKPFKYISNETIKGFMKEKAQEVSGGTVNTYISSAAKMTDNLKAVGANNLDRNEILKIRQELKGQGKNLHKGYYDRAYIPKQTHEIKEYMRTNTPYSISVELQHRAGMRADDAINSNKWQFNKDNTITIKGSKNGLNYTTRELSKDLIQKAIQAKESNYKAHYSDYRQKLTEAGAVNGSHGLRYSYAQERFSQLEQQGKSHNECLAQVSLEMGHSRLEITNHYLKS